jgi:hypothetical protein
MTIIKKSKQAMARIRRVAEPKPATLPARDPVAFAAALQILG